MNSKNQLYEFKPEAINNCSAEKRIEIFTGMVERLGHFVQTLNELYVDNHYWSARPCATCDSASVILGFDIGCTRYRKDPNKGRKK